MVVTRDGPPPLALSIDGISCRDHVGHLPMDPGTQTDANFLLMAALGIRHGGSDCTGPLDVDLVRSALRYGADVNFEGYAGHYNALLLTVCRTMEGTYNATDNARAEEILAMLMEVPGAEIEDQFLIKVKSQHRVILKLLRAGARIDMDNVYGNRDRSRDEQTARGMFLRRVHHAGGFHAYKEARYETMKIVRLVSRDRRVPKEVASYLLEFWASRTLYSHGAERDVFMEEQSAHDDAAEDDDDWDDDLWTGHVNEGPDGGYYW